MSSRDLFAIFRDLLVNIKDLLVICDPTKGISLNNHHLHPINSPMGRRWGTFGLLLICSLGFLFSLYLISCLFGGKTPTRCQQCDLPGGATCHAHTNWYLCSTVAARVLWSCYPYHINISVVVLFLLVGVGFGVGFTAAILVKLHWISKWFHILRILL